MTKNPILNALAAGFYILAVTLIMTLGTQDLPQEDTIIAPIAMLSLFTLSAAVMGYIFCYQPFILYFDGKKKQALDLFIRTVGFFGVFTLGILLLLFSGII